MAGTIFGIPFDDELIYGNVERSTGSISHQR